MATETTIESFEIIGDSLHVFLGDGQGFSINWPPPEDALEQLTASAQGIVPDFIRLLVASHPQPQSLVGAKVVLDFTNPDAIVRLAVPNG
jgi:hypothetical protein